MSQETPEEIYLCPDGHQLQHPGTCPKDGKTVEAAHYICKYCGYATQHSKTGICPNCEAEMLRFNPAARAKRSA